MAAQSAECFPDWEGLAGNALATRAALLPDHAFPKTVPNSVFPKLPIGHG